MSEVCHTELYNKYQKTVLSTFKLILCSFFVIEKFVFVW